jgi:YidC/Oxa1 family membrane protein insertase
LTALIRLALIKSTAAGTAMQSQMGSLQPKMQEIQEKYKDDPEQLSKKTMELLKKDGA